MAGPDSVDYSLSDKFVTCHQVTATIPTCAAGVAGNATTVTITGAKLGDVVIVSGPTVALAHQVGVNGWVSAADTVSLAASGDATGFTGASRTYNVEIHHKS